MSFLRKIISGKDQPVQQAPPQATPSQLLDLLQEGRAAAEQRLLAEYTTCTECNSTYLRIGAWTRGGEAGWTVTCADCGEVIARTTEVK